MPSRRKSLRERGQTLALMVVALPAFVGAVGLAMDVGKFLFQLLQDADCYSTRQRCQTPNVRWDRPVTSAAQTAGWRRFECHRTCSTGSTGTMHPNQTATHGATTLPGVLSLVPVMCTHFDPERMAPFK